MGGDSSTLIPDEETAATGKLIQLGQVGAPYGVRGWVKLRSFTDPPDRLFEHPRLELGSNGAWRTVEIVAHGRSGGRLTAKFAGIDDRDLAQSLTGAVLCVARSELPGRGAGDFYRADLIGCEVVDQSGARLGVVQHFVETPAHALMVVRGEREYWVPAVPQHLRRVDLAARRVTVDWHEPAD
jgi:16S rRNA processing protein RimM